MAELSRHELVRLAEQLYPLLLVIRGDRAVAADATLDVLEQVLEAEAGPGDVLDLALSPAGADDLDPADRALLARHLGSLLRGEQLAAATGQPADGIDERLRLLLTRFEASGGNAGDPGDARQQAHVPPQPPSWFLRLPPLPDGLRGQVEALRDHPRRRDRSSVRSRAVYGRRQRAPSRPPPPRPATR